MNLQVSSIEERGFCQLKVFTEWPDRLDFMFLQNSVVGLYRFFRAYLVIRQPSEIFNKGERIFGEINLSSEKSHPHTVFSGFRQQRENEEQQEKRIKPDSSEPETLRL